MTTLLAFLVTLGVLITVHEFGHFQVARWFGVKVLKFSIGFGKPLYKKILGKDQTEFMIAAFPLGGYVKMLDERESPDTPIAEADLPRAFNRQAVWKRMAIVLAGPCSNLLLAILIYWVLFMQGVTGLKPILGEVPAGTPAALASMKPGELIQEVNGQPVQSWQDVRWLLLQEAARAGSVEVKAVNDGQEFHLHQLSLPKSDDMEQDILDRLGLTPYTPEVPAKVGEVLQGSAAERAGLRPGDKILSIDGKAVTYWDELVDFIRQNPERSLSLQVLRDGAQLSLSVTPDTATENGKKVGRIGAAYHMSQAELDRLLVTTQYNPVAAFAKAAGKTWETSVFSLRMLGNMVIGQVSWKSLSGPVTIASYAGQSADAGWKTFLGFLAVVSISLGILNLLPIPVLDGGHLLYYMVEFIKGSPVSEKAMEVGHRIGFALLGILMACALFNDITRLITG